MTSPASATPRYWYEDFPVGNRRVLGSATVTREAIIDFARQWDPQPYHIDDAAGAVSMFGALSASGWHTGALVHRMLCDAFLIESACLGSPGIEAVKWLKPVLAGDTIRGEVVVLEARPLNSRPGVGAIRWRFEAFNQTDAMIYTMIATTFFRMRPDA